MQGAPKYQKVNCNLTSCPLNNSCKRIGCSIHYNYEHGPEIPSVDYLFITDNPQIAEFKSQTAHASIESRWLQEIIGKANPQATYVLSYLVRGWPIEEKTIPEFLIGTPLNSVRNLTLLDQVRSMPIQRHPEAHRIVSDCIQHLQQEIRQFRPKMLVLLGNAALSVLFPRETRSVTQLMDTTLSYMDTPTRFMPSPGILLRNPSGRRNYEQNMESVLTGRRRQKHTDAGKHTLFTKLSDAIEYIEFLKTSDTEIGFDTETLNVNSRFGNKLACLQFADSDHHAGVIPYHHPQSPFSPDEIEILNQHLTDLFMKPSTIRNWVTHNAKFENLIIRQAFGARMLSAPIWDTWMASFLLDENRSSRAAEFKYGIYSLKQLAYDFLNYDGYEQGILKTREEGNLFDLDLDKLAAYGASDAVLTRRLRSALLLEAEVQNYEPQLENLMLNFYNPEVQLFTDIEWNGFPVDRQHLRTLLSGSSPILQKLREIELEMQEDSNVQMANNVILKRSGGGLTGRVRPLGGSPWVFDFSKLGHPQVLFFDILGLPSGKVGKSGMASVDVEWQEKNSHNPLVKKFMEYVLMKKMYDSFVKQLYDYVDPSGQEVNHNTDARIRPSYLLSSVVTGRVACRNPNLQACPRADSPPKKAIKDIFAAPPGEVLVQLDYKANEVRWVGILAQDPGLASIFNEAKAVLDDYRQNPTPEKLRRAELLGDVHKVNATRMFGIPLEEVTKDQRQASKACVFGILYDSSKWSIAEQYDKSEEEVSIWFDSFYRANPRLEPWKKSMKDFAKAHGYVETPHGRRRRFPIFDMYRDATGYFQDYRVPREQQGLVAEALRQSSNAPVQGLGSDAAMLGASLFARIIERRGLPWTICNAVHDSCVFTCPIADLDEAIKVAEQAFTTDLMDYMTVKFGIHFNLPLEVEFEIGTSWGSLEKWDFSAENLREIKDGLIRVPERYQGQVNI